VPKVRLEYHAPVVVVVDTDAGNVTEVLFGAPDNEPKPSEYFDINADEKIAADADLADAARFIARSQPWPSWSFHG
jgi:hypothetical protein